MAISGDVLDFINAAKAGLARADAINAGMIVRNAEAHLKNAWAYIESEPMAAEAFDAAVAAIREFGREIESSGQIAVRFSERAKEAQVNAIAAIQTFETVVSNARPNDLARSLGLDWF